MFTFIALIVIIELVVTAYVTYYELRRKIIVLCPWHQVNEYPEHYRDVVKSMDTYTIWYHIKGPATVLCPEHKLPLETSAT